jgi:glycosyltransferase involved in cell wall biosynthesis
VLSLRSGVNPLNGTALVRSEESAAVRDPDPHARLSIMHFLAPAPMGGLEYVVQALAGGHRSRGHTVHVGAILRPGTMVPPFLDALRGEGVEVHVLEIPGMDYYLEWRRVSQLCSGIRPDVVHTHGYRSDLIDAWAARRANTATVTTLHGFTSADWKNQVYQSLQRYAARWFDAVVAVSGPIADRVRRSGTPAPKIHVIPNAFSGGPILSAVEAREVLGIGDSLVRFGWIGRITRDKGLDILIDALSRLRDSSWRLSVIGDGPDADRARATAAAGGIVDRIDWHGAIRDAGRLLRAFDVFVLSSRTEGTPIVLFEAMAAETAVVASRVGGVPDVVSDREAVLVPAEAPAALADALRRVIADLGAASTRVAAARERLAQFALEPWLARYENVYRGIRRSGEAQETHQ